jgi:hypothetical protein
MVPTSNVERAVSPPAECDTLPALANKRHSPPLFEVLERQSGRVDRPQAESSPAHVKPQGSEHEPVAPDRAVKTSSTRQAAQPSASSDPAPNAARGEIRVPLAGVWTAVVVAVGVAFVTWTIGYNVGFGNGQSEQASAFGIGAGRIQDPLIDTSDADLSRGTEGSQATQATNSAGAVGTSTATNPGNPRALVIAGDGRQVADPRRAGNNYLALATLPEPSARSAVRYLANEGINSIAVPVDPIAGGVDSRGNSGNNPSPVLYELFSVDLEVPSGRFRESAEQRQALADRVARIGRQWLQNGGASDFSKPQWKRYDGP